MRPLTSKSPSKTGCLFGCGLLLLIFSSVLLPISIIELIDEPSSGLVIAVICFSILVVVGVLFLLKGRLRKNPPNETPLDKQKEIDINEALARVRSGNIGIIGFTGMEPNLIKKRGEKVIFLMPNINLMEHTTMIKVSGGGGISFHGIGLSSGISSETQEEKEVLDNGRLTLTNDRLVFDGEKRSSETMLADILVITPYLDGIGVKSRARDKVQYFVIVNSKQCTAQMTCGERVYEKPIDGEWLAAIVEGAIHSRENLR